MDPWKLNVKVIGGACFRISKYLFQDKGNKNGTVKVQFIDMTSDSGRARPYLGVNAPPLHLNGGTVIHVDRNRAPKD